MPPPLKPLEDKYEMVAKLREGGMGAIYKVRHRLLDEERVVKTLRSHLADDADLHRRFALEAKAAIRLRHPHVVQIFDFLIEDGVGYIVMEHIEGIDLGELISRRHPPSLALGLEIAAQSLLALGFLHRQGFIHRDISPDNLMLSRDHDKRPFVKLIDLGIAKESEDDLDLTGSEMFLGKFRYSSPEHFGSAGLAGVEARSDLYALGVVLYELLTGHFPIVGETNTQLIAGHLHQPPRDFAQTDPNGRLPKDLRRLLLRALAKDPDQRFATADAFIAALDEPRGRYPLDGTALTELERLLQQAQEADFDATIPLSDVPRSDAAIPTPVAVPSDATSSDGTPDPGANGESAFDHHLRAACLLAGEQSYREAITHFEAALALEPDNDTVVQMLEEVREKLDAERGESQRRRTEEVERLQEIFAAGELELARRRLASARRVYGDDDDFGDLDRQIAAAEEDRERRRIGELLETVKSERAAGELTAALRTLEGARAAAEELGDESFVDLLESEERDLEAAHKRAADLDEALHAAEEAIAAGRLLMADRLIFQAREALGTDPRLTEMSARLDELYHHGAAQDPTGDPERQVARLVHRAGLAVERQRFAEAEALLGEALALDPANEWLEKQHRRVKASLEGV